MTEGLHFHLSLSCIGEGNGNPLQCSWLENPRDRGAWWAAVYGVAQSRTRLKRLNSSSSILLWYWCYNHDYHFTSKETGSQRLSNGKKKKKKKQNWDLKLGFNSNTLSFKLHLLRRFLKHLSKRDSKNNSTAKEITIWCMALWIDIHICSLLSVTMSHV